MPNQELGTNTIAQIALVVRDVEAKARAWAKVLGLPLPQITVTDPVEVAHTEYEGEPSPGQAKLAFFHFDNIDVELIEPIGGPTTWQDQLDWHGDSIHHIAFRIQGMAEKLVVLDTEGISIIQRGDYAGGRYAYLDAAAPLGLIIELLEDD